MNGQVFGRREPLAAIVRSVVAIMNLETSFNEVFRAMVRTTTLGPPRANRDRGESREAAL